MSQVDIRQAPEAQLSEVNTRPSAEDSADSRLLGFVFLCGPIAWGLQLLIGYFLVSLSCVVTSSKWPVYALSAVAGLLTLLAGFLAFLNWRKYLRRGHAGIAGLDSPDDAREFVVTSGTLLSSIFFLLILVTGVVAYFLSPCPYITMVVP